MKKNHWFNNARRIKNDEFYSRSEDIDREVKNYEEHFYNKVVFCNCNDDPAFSAFWSFFHLNFSRLGLKGLFATSYNKDGPAFWFQYFGGDDGDISRFGKLRLTEGGDFRSSECVEILKKADIVATNPPFSLFRPFIVQLMEHEKEIMVMGQMNSVSFQKIFPFFKEGKIWLDSFEKRNSYFFIPPGHVETITQKGFYDPGSGLVRFRSIFWFSNLGRPPKREPLSLTKAFVPEDFPKYDDYDAINVNKIADIPKDYFEKMGVPVTIFEHYYFEQFEILDSVKPKLNGKNLFQRIIIKRK